MEPSVEPLQLTSVAEALGEMTTSSTVTVPETVPGQLLVA